MKALPGVTVIDTTDVSRGSTGHSNFLRSAVACRDFVDVIAGKSARPERIAFKPGGVARNLIGEITRRIEARGLKVVGLSLLNATKETAEAHYDEHRERPFFAGVVNYLTSGPIVATS